MTASVSKAAARQPQAGRLDQLAEYPGKLWFGGHK
jgi:hypothetical protein